jgi:hypothetical protein
MKPKSLSLAIWMLDHLTFGPHKAALTGDLLEEFLHGCSVQWFWRQVLSAIGVGAFTRSRAYMLPLVFSAAWSVIYPAWWLSITRNRLTQMIFTQWSTHDWPYSTALKGVSEIVPAITFVWLGLFVYLMLRAEMTHAPSKLRLFASLSISLNVLVVTTIGMSLSLNHFRAHLSYVAGEGPSFNPHLIAINIPLALSLLSAVSFALSRAQPHGNTSVTG